MTICASILGNQNVQNYTTFGSLEKNTFILINLEY